jgi:tricarballylate dehydrogenase
MKKNGVRFQPSLSGTLQLSRTNAFFMGGGKALLNAYYRSANSRGVKICYDSPVDSLEIHDGKFVAAHCKGARIESRAAVLAAGGFESNLAWLREAWGQNERGEWPGENLLIRGTRFDQGVLVKHLQGQGADFIGEPSQSHGVAVDARAPKFDGGIATRVDAVSLGIVVNCDALRFYDEGEDFWPKRYAIWGRLVAQQPRQIGYCIIDSKAMGHFMPTVFPPTRAETLPELARLLTLDEDAFVRTVRGFNAACRPGAFDHTFLDDCKTDGITPPKSHWARPIDTPPFYGYALRPGITFTYMGLLTDEHAAVHFGGVPSENLFVAGEMMAGNVLGKGYTAGVGMSIGTVFGRIAGTEAAHAILKGRAHARA